MKRLMLFLSLFMILATITAFAATKPPQQKKTSEKPAQEAPPAKNKFIIRLKDGGSIETSNYTYENGKIKIAMPSGSMSLERSMVLKIEEIMNDEDAASQNIIKLPDETRGAKSPASRQAQPSSAPAPYRAEPSVPADNNGHTQLWWKGKIAEWKKKLAEAQARYEKAQDDWNKYNGLVSTLPAGTTTNPTVSDFQATQYQDLRGSARVAMDQAQADIEEAKRMLEEGLPDEARQAGAPPGWVR
jgi:hypothetical protein